jgi:hypothetical protein
MTLSFKPHQTRREFLAGLAAGLVSLQSGQVANLQITGATNPKLVAYDQLMARFMREHNPPGAGRYGIQQAIILVPLFVVLLALIQERKRRKHGL